MESGLDEGEAPLTKRRQIRVSPSPKRTRAGGLALLAATATGVATSAGRFGLGRVGWIHHVFYGASLVGALVDLTRTGRRFGRGDLGPVVTTGALLALPWMPGGSRRHVAVATLALGGRFVPLRWSSEGRRRRRPNGQAKARNQVKNPAARFLSHRAAERRRRSAAVS